MLLGFHSRFLRVDDTPLEPNKAKPNTPHNVCAKSGRVSTKGVKNVSVCYERNKKKVVLSLAVVLIAGLGIGIPVAAQTVVIEDGLIGYWSFDKNTVKGNTVKDIWGNQDAEMIGKLQIVQGKFGEAVQLGGGAGARVQMTDDIKKAELPTEGMTVELWAWDEQFIEWGGYIVAVQDNGAFEISNRVQENLGRPVSCPL